MLNIDENDWDDDDINDTESDEDYSDIPDVEEEDAEPVVIQQSGSDKDNFAEVRLEKRIARLDITKNSEEDHRSLNRHTKSDLSEQVKKDYRYMKGKSYFMVQPFLILDEYPYKAKSSDSDIIRKDGKNVAEDIVLVIGRLPKLKGTEEFKNKPYIRGEIMLIKAGNYDIGPLKPHFALVVKKKYKVIKQGKIRVRDLFDSVKNELQNGKPFVVYKEFPKMLI